MHCHRLEEMLKNASSSTNNRRATSERISNSNASTMRNMRACKACSKKQWKGKSECEAQDRAQKNISNEIVNRRLSSLKIVYISRCKGVFNWGKEDDNRVARGCRDGKWKWEWEFCGSFAAAAAAPKREGKPAGREKRKRIYSTSG